MTDPILPPDDELVSAHLDGETTPDEAGLIEAGLIEAGLIEAGLTDTGVTGRDGDVRARRAELESVRSLVGAPITVPAQGREDAIAAALDVFDHQLEGDRDHDGSGPEVAPVDDLGARRAARRRVRILSVAAALVVIVGVLAGLRLTQSSRRVDTAASNLASAPVSTTSGSSSQAAAAGSDDAKTDANQNQPEVASASTTSSTRAASPTGSPGPAGAPIDRGDLGAITTSAQLRQAVGAPGPTSSETRSTDLQSPPSQQFSADSDLARCDTIIRSQDHELGALSQRATVTFRTTPAWVLVYTLDSSRVPSGGTRVYAVDRSSCRVLDVQTL
jgi:hypothetical protein